MKALYRDAHGEMVELVKVFIPEQFHDELDDETAYPVLVGPQGSDQYDDWDTAVAHHEIVAQVEPKIAGSYERWG